MRLKPLALDEHVFDEPLSDEAKYWIGFLLTDGCMVDKGHCRSQLILQVDIADAGIIKKFKSFMKSGHKITYPAHSKDGSIACRIAFTCSNRLRDILASYGIVPRKTELCSAPDILLHDKDFWRGCIDGDGNIGYYKKYPRIRLSGTKKLLNQFVDFVVHDIKSDHDVNIWPDRSIFAVQFFGKKSLPVIKALYKDSCVSLLRKYNTAVNIMENTSYAR